MREAEQRDRCSDAPCSRQRGQQVRLAEEGARFHTLLLSTAGGPSE